MPWHKKHGRLIQIMMMVSIPILVSFCSGVWLSHLVTESQYKGMEGIQSRKLVVEAQMLADQLTERMNLFRMQASMIAQLKSPSLPFSQGSLQNLNGIILWAELDFNSGSSKKVEVRRSVRNTQIEERVASLYLSKYINKLELSHSKVSSALQMHGIYVPESVSESIDDKLAGYSLLFQAQGSSRLAYLVLVDPLQVFAPFQQWQRHSQGGLSQSALLGSNAQVLSQSHSDSLLLKKLMDHPFFRFQLDKLTQRIIFQGKGAFNLDGGSSIQASFLALTHLPWVIVVGEKSSVISPLPWHHGVLWFYAVLVLLAIFSSAWLVSLYLEKNLKQVMPVTLVAPRSDVVLNEQHSHHNEWNSDAMQAPHFYSHLRDLDH